MTNSKEFSKNSRLLGIIISCVFSLGAAATLFLYVYYLVLGEKFSIIFFIICAIIAAVAIVKTASGKLAEKDVLLRFSNKENIYKLMDEEGSVKISKKVIITKDYIFLYRSGIRAYNLNTALKVGGTEPASKYLGVRKAAGRCQILFRDGYTEEFSFGNGERAMKEYDAFIKALKERCPAAEFGSEKM